MCLPPCVDTKARGHLCSNRILFHVYLQRLIRKQGSRDTFGRRANKRAPRNATRARDLYELDKVSAHGLRLLRYSGTQPWGFCVPSFCEWVGNSWLAGSWLSGKRSDGKNSAFGATRFLRKCEREYILFTKLKQENFPQASCRAMSDDMHGVIAPRHDRRRHAARLIGLRSANKKKRPAKGPLLRSALRSALVACALLGAAGLVDRLFRVRALHVPGAFGASRRAAAQ